MSATDTIASSAERAAADARSFLSAVFEQGSIVELRCLEVGAGSWPKTYSGYFDDFEKLVDAALMFTRTAKGCYVILNRIDPALLARRANAISAIGKSDPLTGDHEVAQRTWLFIDLDAKRAAGISSTDVEHEAAIEKARHIRDVLRTEGWPAPLMVDSGNGAAIYFKINIPPDDRGLIKRCLEALALRFDDAAVHVDSTVHNPARLVRLPGTLNRKGSHTTERPHRWARILETPESLETVSVEQLEALAGELPEEPGPESDGAAKQRNFDLAQWITEHGLQVEGPESWRGAGWRWIFPVCPWNSEHANRSAVLLQFPSGAIAASCRHNGCAGKGWHDLRDLIEPGWREKREKKSKRGRKKKSRPKPADLSGRTVEDLRAELNWILDGVLNIREREKGEDPEKDLMSFVAAEDGFSVAIDVLADPGVAADRQGAIARTCIVVYSLVKLCAEVVGRASSFAIDLGRHLHVYRGGAYRADGEEHVLREFQRLLERWEEFKLWSPTVAGNVVEYLTLKAKTLWTAPPLDVVNVANGLLRLRTKELLPHSPDFLSTVQLPVSFDPTASCNRWERFVEDCFPSDAQSLGFEIPALLMTSFTGLQKAIMLTGAGENGKSRYLAALVAFLGSENVSCRTLHDLEENRFAPVSLLNKLANVAADLPAAEIEGSSIFKSCSGEDVKLGAERKFEQAFEFKPFARLIFSANQPPICSDATAAFFRRWLVIPFIATFPPERRVLAHILDGELAHPAELSGVLNRCLELLPGLLEHGFTESETTREAFQEFRASTSPVLVWLESNTLEGSSLSVAKEDLLAAYNRSAAERGRPRLSPHAMTAAVKSWRPPLEESKRLVRGIQKWVWLGLGLRSKDLREERGQRRDREPGQDG